MKIIIVALIAFLLGFGAYWGYNNYQSLLKENKELKETSKKIPSSVDSNTVFPTDIPSPTQSEELGNIEGVLGYPASGIPELEVYAFNADDLNKYFKIKTAVNHNNFTFKDLTPGTYYVVAYTTEDNPISGAYSKMVPCGLSVECTDHSLIPVKVNPGATTTGVEVRDWYAPEGTFPKKP